MKTHRWWFEIFLALFAFAIVACTVGPQPKIETQTDRIAAAYVEIKSLAQTVEVSRQQGILTNEQAFDLKTKLKIAFDQLEQARAYMKLGKPTNSIEALQVVNQILLEIRSTLGGSDGSKVNFRYYYIPYQFISTTRYQLV